MFVIIHREISLCKTACNHKISEKLLICNVLSSEKSKSQKNKVVIIVGTSQMYVLKDYYEVLIISRLHFP